MSTTRLRVSWTMHVLKSVRNLEWSVFKSYFNVIMFDKFCMQCTVSLCEYVNLRLRVSRNNTSFKQCKKFGMECFPVLFQHQYVWQVLYAMYSVHMGNVVHLVCIYGLSVNRCRYDHIPMQLNIWRLEVSFNCHFISPCMFLLSIINMQKKKKQPLDYSSHLYQNWQNENESLFFYERF